MSSCSGDNKETEWPQITKENKPWTRWWWLGSDVDSANLTYNLEALASAGIGGVEITPIYGVKGRETHYIDYLSPHWMKMLAFTISESERLGLGVDMNNGTGWPFGGPEVSIEDAATKAFFQEYKLAGGKNLSEPLTIKDPKQKDIARLEKLMAYGSDEETIDLTDKVNDKGILLWSAPSGKDFKLVGLFIGKTRQKVKRAAPGGEGYVLDHFNKEAVQRYLNQFDKAFTENNTPFPQTFFNDSYEVYGADWTPSLLQEFEKRRGYRLQDHFPKLLENGENEMSARIIADYRETIGELLNENFTRTWTEWAHSHGVKTRNQAHGSPANLLDIYAAVDIPECESFGITDFDIPFLRKDSIRKKNDSDRSILKYASSAAHVAGKQYTSSETFTWLTEHFRTSLSQCKPEIDQMFTSGVNRVYFHGTTYSPKEAAWPGWKFYASVDMSPTNTLWKDAPAFFQYITRVQSFLQSGQPDNDFLLYLPMYDIWEEQRGGYFTTFAIHGMRERLPDFCNAVDRIMECGYDLDYVSDHFLRSTVTENGFLKTEGGAVYKALILPAVKYIPEETMAQIIKLAEQGATIVFAEQFPSDVPGLARLEERRTSFNSLLQKLPQSASFDSVSSTALDKGTIVTGSNYKEILSLWKENEEYFVSHLGGQLIRRRHDSGHTYFFTMLKNNPVNEWVKLGVQAKSAMFFDPLTGKKGWADIRQNNGRSEVYLQLEPGQSVILKTFDHDKKSKDDWIYYQPTNNITSLTEGWKLTFEESDPTISETFSLDSLCSWTDLSHDSLKVNRGTGLYTLNFNIEKKEGCEYLLSLGDVRESAQVKINGEYVATLFSVPFQTMIGSFLRDGENSIEVEVTNLPANRISDYDRRGIEWRIFHEINFVSITYKPTLFDHWEPLPSGLLGPVMIHELQPKNPL